MDACTPGKSEFKLVTVEDYEPLIGAEAVERICRKAECLRDLHVINVNSTYYGGGVAEILSSLTLLMNGCGVRTGWRVIQGRPDFFTITKKMHNALQGDEINLSELKRNIYEEVVFENAARMHLDHDLVIVHDPQPLPLIDFFRKKNPWVWRCHIDLSHPHPQLWGYLASFVERYDTVVLSLPEYAQMVPALAVVAIYALLLAWNDYLYQAVLLSLRNMTVSMTQGQLFADVHAEWNATMAAAIIYVLPPIALLFAFRRCIVASLTMVSSGAWRDLLARSRAEREFPDSPSRRAPPPDSWQSACVRLQWSGLFLTQRWSKPDSNSRSHPDGELS